MAFPTKDGKSYGSKFVAKRKDSEHAKMGMGAPEAEGEGLMKKATPAPMPGAPMAGADEQKPEGAMAEDPKQVVATHGKANTIHIAHDHKNGKHHVISTHEDGSVHESEHPDAKAAHDAAAALAGSGDQPMSGSMGAPEMPDSDGFVTPKLA